MPSFQRTVLVNAVSQLINYGLPLVTFSVLTRAFDLPLYGMWIEANTVSGLLVTFGTQGFGDALAAMLAGQDDQEMLYSAALLLFLAAAGGLTLAMLAAAPLINAITIRDAAGTALLRTVALVVLIMALNWLASQVFRLRLQPGRGAAFDIALAVTRLLVVLLAARGDLLSFARIFVASQLALTVLQITVAYWGMRLRQPTWDVLKRMSRHAVNLSVVTQARWFVMYGDRLLLSIFAASTAVAIYSASYQMALILLALGWPFVYAVLPLMTAQWSSGDRATMLATVRRNTRFMSIVLIPAAVGLAVTGGSLLRVIGTDEFSVGGWLIAMIAGGIALDTVGVNLQYIFQVQGQTRVLRKLYVRAAILNLVANLIAIPLFGYHGAAATTLLTFIYLLVALQRATGIAAGALFDLSTAARSLAASLGMGAWALVWAAPSVPRLAIAIGGGALIYGALALLLRVMTPHELRHITRTLLIRQPSGDAPGSAPTA